MTEPRDLDRTHRSLVLSRAFLAGAAGMVPVPYLDDLLAGAVRSALVRRLGQLRRVDLDASALEALSTPSHSRLLGAASVGAAVLGTTRRAFRRLAASLLFVRRADEALQTFQVGTLFDHYCARHHVGLGVDGAKALALRRAIDRAVEDARGDALGAAFRRVLRSSARAAGYVPRGVRAFWAKRRGGPIDAETVTEEIDRAASSSFIQKATASFDAELERSYLGALTRAFDAAWLEEKQALERSA